jgi:hypothetical protein
MLSLGSVTGWMACSLLSLSGCGDAASTSASSQPATASLQVPTTGSAAPAQRASAVASGISSAFTPPPDGPFVRHPPHTTNSDADAIDLCTQTGGNYFSCGGAHGSETDPIMRRYLLRIAKGHVAGVSGYGKRSGSDETDIPHAEVPFMCDVTKPCGYKDATGNEWNSGATCFARAHIAGTVAAARKAHEHACKCNPGAGPLAGYNQTAYICDDRGRPAFLAPDMPKDEGADIIDCAICQPSRGPGACEREAKRLESTDKELAELIRKRQMARCRTPNEGPGSW